MTHPGTLGDIVAQSTANRRFDAVAFIMSYEAGELADEDIIPGFQSLIDSRIIWSLQGHYQRIAEALIRDGHCTL